MADFEYGTEFDDDVIVGSFRPVKRYLITPLGGYFPVLFKLKNGDLAVVYRMGDYHVGQRGCLDISLSKDGGKKWTLPKIVTVSESDDRNPAFCQLKDGTLLVSFVRPRGYKNGLWQSGKMVYEELYTTRSKDNGETWSKPEPMQIPPECKKIGSLSPYGKMLQLKDGTVIQGLQVGPGTKESPCKSYVIRSEDNGHTWGDETLIADGGYNETAFLALSDDEILVDMRTDDGGMAISRSKDCGYKWTKPKRLTKSGEHPGDLCLLKSGNVLLTFGYRLVPYGVHALLSSDGGQTWMLDKRAILVSYATNGDCGYPSSVQLDDGTIYTAYYSTTCLKYREADANIGWGIHAAGIAYKEDIFER